jgi:hypothetical protein
MIIILLAFGLVIGFSAPAVFAADQPSRAKAESQSEKQWGKAIKTQVALAKVKVALLYARSELWLNKNKEATLRSLEEAKTYLDEAYQSADKSTREQIYALKIDVETAMNSVRKKGEQATSELSALADRSEAALNTAIAETQTKAAALKKETATRMALVQAKAAQLKAKIALEIDNAPEKAKQALINAEKYLADARASASKRAAQEIAKLQSQTRETKKAITDNVKEAKGKLDALIVYTEERLQGYGTRIRESEELGLLKKRYAQLEAQASLLKARLATEKEATYEQAHYYLDEAKAWYARAKEEAGKEVGQKIADIEKHIDKTKVALKKTKEARKEIADLLKRAADIINRKE